MKAIDTEYNGYKFRSRLEARWAVFFDALGVKYEYEPQGFEFEDGTRYLPDFWLPEHEIWVEVKGQYPTEEEKRLCELLSEGTDKYVCVVCDFPLPELNNAQVWKTYMNYGAYGPDGPLAVSIPTEAEEESILDFTNGHDCFNGMGWGVSVKCPICSCENVHLASAENRSGNDDYQAWGGRGDAVYVEMFCESGCSWDLRLGFHKGTTYMGIENAKTTITDLGLVLADGDKAKLIEAYKTARSARFEFGQTPKAR